MHKNGKELCTAASLGQTIKKWWKPHNCNYLKHHLPYVEYHTHTHARTHTWFEHCCVTVNNIVLRYVIGKWPIVLLKLCRATQIFLFMVILNLATNKAKHDGDNVKWSSGTAKM